MLLLSHENKDKSNIIIRMLILCKIKCILKMSSLLLRYVFLELKTVSQRRKWQQHPPIRIPIPLVKMTIISQKCQYL